MSTSFPGILFDGESLKTRPADVTICDPLIVVVADGFRLEANLAGIRVSTRLGRLPRYVYLPNGATVETFDHPAVDALQNRMARGRWAALVPWLESQAPLAAVATVLVVASVALAVFLGLPAAARHAALNVPESIDRRAGQAALATFSRFTQPSRLTAAQAGRVRELAARIAGHRGVDPPHIEFRSIGGRFPNAFALPGRIIVVTDELLALDASDDELSAVLAHELGHLENRHSLQSVFRGSAALLLVSAITGDLSTLTTFSASIPIVLLQRGYSREFEVAADLHAVETLHQAGINVDSFATILKKLETSRPSAGPDYSWFSTHPATEDRIRALSATNPTPPSPPPSTTPEKRTGSAPDPSSDPLTIGFPPLEKLPEALFQPSPDYPLAMRQTGVSGTVIVMFVVDPAGNVSSAQVVSSTNPAFEAPALASVSQWKFRPGLHRGQPAAARLHVPIIFQLSDHAVGPTTPPQIPGKSPDPGEPGTNH